MNACPRCGTTYDGSFCPRCGLPAARQATPIPAAAYRGLCPRCGTYFVGNFCPRCGLPAGAIAPPRRLSSSTRRFLTGVWTFAFAAFIVLILVNFVGLLAAPFSVIPAAQGIARGSAADPGITPGATPWTFAPITSGAAGSVVPSGGNPDAYLQMDLPAGGLSAGMWSEPVVLNGSVPFAAAAALDVSVNAAPGFAGRVVVALEGSPGAPDLKTAAVVWHNASTSAWSAPPEVDVSGALAGPGTYYLKVAFYAQNATSDTIVGFDNVRLAWATDAFVYFYLPLPLPEFFFVSQDPGIYIGYFAFLMAAIILSAAYYTVRERKILVAALRAPADAIGTRLRSMSAWVAIAQAWMAAIFLQELIIILYLGITGTEPPSPIGSPTVSTSWPLLFELAGASVYEELVFRLLLIGVPLMIGSLLMRAVRAAPPGTPQAPLSHSFRYLVGGNLRKSSSKEALLGAWILLFASAAIFGYAHAPGWGWWKVIPAMVAGLAFGYLFLRHGIGAAILAHFATDYISAISWEGIGGDTATILLGLLLLGLAALGSGFFAWYAIDAWDHLKELLRRYSANPAAPPAPPGYPITSTSWAAAPSTPPSPPSVVPPAQAPAPPAPSAGYAPWNPPPGAARDPTAIPREYVPTYRPPPYGYPPVRFQCPNCGWVEAKYDAGRFTCLRCGRTT